MRTPLTLITGPLGSGKTTLLRHILAKPDRKIAIIMNEFGEIGIDGIIIKGNNIEIKELEGGCVCCSLIGEFEEAINEILEKIKPDTIVVETTGLAEPDALIFDIQEALPQIRLDGVIGVIDLEGMIRFPQVGRTLKIQIENADLLILNKVDLVSEEQLLACELDLRKINPTASFIPAKYCRVDADLLFGIGRDKTISQPSHKEHQIDCITINYESKKIIDEKKFSQFADSLPSEIIRAKGFVQFPQGTFLFNYVSGRWDLEPFEREDNLLVFIGKKPSRDILNELKQCEIN